MLPGHQPERMCTEETCDDIDEVIVHGEHAGTGVWWGGGDSSGGSAEHLPPSVAAGRIRIRAPARAAECADPNGRRSRSVMTLVRWLAKAAPLRLSTQSVATSCVRLQLGLQLVDCRRGVDSRAGGVQQYVFPMARAMK
jgi:hypothetical protein